MHNVTLPLMNGKAGESLIPKRWSELGRETRGALRRRRVVLVTGEACSGHRLGCRFGLAHNQAGGQRHGGHCERRGTGRDTAKADGIQPITAR
jgi:hypothetical protein